MSSKPDAFRAETREFGSGQPDRTSTRLMLARNDWAALANLRNRTPIAALRALGRLRQTLDYMEPILVARSRKTGASWAEIGSALGVSRQSVHETYSSRRSK